MTVHRKFCCGIGFLLMFAPVMALADVNLCVPKYPHTGAIYSGSCNSDGYCTKTVNGVTYAFVWSCGKDSGVSGFDYSSYSQRFVSSISDASSSDSTVGCYMRMVAPALSSKWAQVYTYTSDGSLTALAKCNIGSGSTTYCSVQANHALTDFNSVGRFLNGISDSLQSVEY